MINNKMVFIKLIILSALISLASCETDIDNVGLDLINNNSFDTNKLTFEVIAYNQNVEKSRVENVATTNLGVLNDETFGVLRAGFVTQVGIPTTNVDFGDNPSIDDVIINLPYNYTKDSTSNDVDYFTLNNIHGEIDQTFNLTINRLGDYLNSLDEQDPTQPKKYYSDQVYSKTFELYSGSFKPDVEHRKYLVRRMEFDEIVDGVLEESNDTIEKSDKSPFIAWKLNKEFFRDNFLPISNLSNFESNNSFIQFFNGLHFEVTEDNGSLMMLDLSLGTMDIFYTTGIETDETDTDLNGDGDTNDENVLVRTKKVMQFPLNSGVKNNFYNRNYSTSTIQNLLDSPNTVNGEDKLYLQGCAGSNAVIDIFNGMDLTALRQNNWLINEANLVMYIDKDISDNNDFIPSRLLLYKLDPDTTNELDENTQILDLFTEGEATFGGIATTVEGDVSDKLSYKFNITDYISEVLKSDDPIDASVFGLKTYHSSDLPLSTVDTIIKQYSWDPKGVVIYGNNIPENDVNYNKRLKLEISYSELNN